MTLINVLESNVVDVPSDVLITTLHPTTGWFGETNGEIYSSAGNMFHSVAMAAKPLVDGQVLFVPATKPHAGKFRHVIFVVDNLSRSISELVTIGLQEAEKHDDLQTVTFPIFRAKVTAGIHQANNWWLQIDLTLAVRQFVEANSPRITHISIAYEVGRRLGTKTPKVVRRTSPI